MHIVFVTVEFITENGFYGGLSNFTTNMSRIFAENGHKVSIITLSKKNNTLYYAENIMVYRIAEQEIRTRIFRGDYLIELEEFEMDCRMAKAVKYKIASINKENKVDIIHYCNLRSTSLFRIKEIPAIVRMSSYQPEVRSAYKPTYNPNQKEKLTLFEKLELYSIRKADLIISPSKIVAGNIQRKLKRKVKVIESPFIMPKEELDDFLYKKELEGKKYLLFYGTLGYIKGTYTIAEMLYKFLRDYKEYYFVFIGNDKGFMKNEKPISAVKIIMEKAGEFAGRVVYIKPILEKEKLFPIIKNAQACILPSRVDNLPNTCIESMALGNIVVGTYDTSFEQLIRNGYNGFLTERDNPESLREAIDKVLSLTKEDRKFIVQKALKRVSIMSPDNIYKKYYKCYLDTIQNFKNKR